jgi:adenosine/AMP kinase
MEKCFPQNLQLTNHENSSWLLLKIAGSNTQLTKIYRSEIWIMLLRVLFHVNVLYEVRKLHMVVVVVVCV